MAADTLSSRTITNLDANPIVYDQAGFNIAGELSQASDYCSATTGGLVSTSSLYKLVRLRSNVKLKDMKFFVSTPLDTNGTKTLTWDFGAYYSDSTQDGTQSQLQGTLISANVFGAVIVSPATAKLPGAVTILPFAPANMDQMLWDFLALSSDPGGYIDVVAAVHAAAATAAAGDLGIIVSFTSP